MDRAREEERRAGSVFRTGARVSAVQAALFPVIASSALLLGIGEFVADRFEGLSRASPRLFLVFCGAFVLVALLGLAITPAEKALVARGDAGAAASGGNVACFGHMATVAFFSWWIAFALLGGSGEAPSIAAGTLMPLRWGLTFELVLVGGWVWIIAFVALRHRLLPGAFVAVSVCKALSFWGAFAAFVARDEPLLLVGVGAAVVFGSLWHAWIAAIFWREAAHGETRRAEAALAADGCDAVT